MQNTNLCRFPHEPPLIYTQLFLEITEEEDHKMTASDEELEEDVFRKRKAELISAGTGAAAGELRLCLNDTL